MSDFYRLTERGEEQIEPLNGLVEFVVNGPRLVELIQSIIIERRSFDTAREIGEAVVATLDAIEGG